MSKSMGLSLDFGRWAYPRRLVDVSDDGIVSVDGDVLDGDLLLACAAMAVSPLPCSWRIGCSSGLFSSVRSAGLTDDLILNAKGEFPSLRM